MPLHLNLGQSVAVEIANKFESLANLSKTFDSVLPKSNWIDNVLSQSTASTISELGKNCLNIHFPVSDLEKVSNINLDNDKVWSAFSKLNSRLINSGKSFNSITIPAIEFTEGYSLSKVHKQFDSIKFSNIDLVINNESKSSICTGILDTICNEISIDVEINDFDTKRNSIKKYLENSFREIDISVFNKSNRESTVFHQGSCSLSTKIAGDFLSRSSYVNQINEDASLELKNILEASLEKIIEGTGSWDATCEEAQKIYNTFCHSFLHNIAKTIKQIVAKYFKEWFAAILSAFFVVYNILHRKYLYLSTPYFIKFFEILDIYSTYKRQQDWNLIYNYPSNHKNSLTYEFSKYPAFDLRN